MLDTGYGKSGNEYVDEHEHYCFLRMEEMRLETGWFRTAVQLEARSDADVSGITADGRKYVAELKGCRFRMSGGVLHDPKGGKDYDAVIIEGHKYISLMTYAYEGFTPLYITFLSDGSAIIHNLQRLTKRPRRFRQACWSESNQRSEYSMKLLLDVSEGCKWVC